MECPDIQRTARVSLLGLALLGLVSCGGSGGGKPSSPVAAAVGGKTLDDFQYQEKRDVIKNEDGLIVGGRRSQFEGRRQVAFGGEFEKQAYSTRNYKSRQWSGDKDYSRKSFAGNTDASQYRVASALDGEVARGAAQQSRYSGQAARTSTYHTPTARESGAAGVPRSSNHHADDHFPKPHIVPYRDYQKMTIEESKNLLKGDN